MSISLEKEFYKLIPSNFQTAIMYASRVAEDSGVNIYLIGGIVRDLILNNQIKDIDIAVESDAIEFAKLLEQELDCEIINIQENLKTAKVQFKDGTEIDFASTREETYTQSGVLPVACNFGCKLEKDVKRRDFTINTLALSLNDEQKFLLIDYYDGYNDIQNKQIKILHDKSFIDDPSRIIRALKFKVRFDFDIEKNTYNLMQNYLKNINPFMPLERIKSELKQYFAIQRENIYEYLISTNAYKLVSNNPILDFNCNNIKDYENKWFIYFALLIINMEIDERLNLTSTQKKILNEVKELLNVKTIESNYEIYSKYANKNDVSLKLYEILSNDITVEKYINELQNIKVMITGKDLINLGLSPSPEFNIILENILKEKLDNKLKTKEEELEFAKQYIKKEE